MKFTKMHGIGNDYVYVNLFEEKVEEPAELSKRISDRHFGIGSDGLIMIAPSDTADFRMIMYNADGSEGNMCGNGIRCVGKYVYDHGLTDKKEISIETKSGIKKLRLNVNETTGKVDTVTVDMGAPILKAADIPVLVEDEKGTAIAVKIAVRGEQYTVTCVSMGNPHCVMFTDKDIKKMSLTDCGEFFEKHKAFPDRVNTEFVNVIDEEHLSMRVWERGSGETLACGTGACAVAVAAILNGLAKQEVTVSLRGGDLTIKWEGGDSPVYMTGPATEVFNGEYLL